MNFVSGFWWRGLIYLSQHNGWEQASSVHHLFTIEFSFNTQNFLLFREQCMINNKKGVFQTAQHKLKSKA